MTKALAGPLDGVRILDMTRILAGPTCAQLLGDLGADVIKIERPGMGDDTRTWGPPFLTGADGEPTRESAYYLAVNRNKRSVTIDFSRPKGVALVKQLLKKCDVLAHNLKVGALEKYGLGYEQIKDEFPNVVYCAISGFGRTGPYANRPGYDALAQAMGGIMSLTGDPAGEPVRVGVGISDIMCGMYASSAILAALRYRDKTGKGQLIDLGLLDTTVAWMSNEALNYFTSGKLPIRRGNQHANIVPYQVFPTKDGYFYLAAGNDGQFKRFCEFAGAPELAADPRYATNPKRLENRAEIVAKIEKLTPAKTTQEWIDGLKERNVPAAPVYTLDQTFTDPQIINREMKIEMDDDHAKGGKVSLLGNPIKLSATPVTYRRPPPTLGQHTDEVLREILDLDDSALSGLRDDGLI
ncbi:MAG: CoA transferase [Rhodospirillaceae bacterium]